MTEKNVLLVDAHVHIHSCFDTGKFLNAANKNFRRQQKTQNIESVTGVLMLTESAWDNWFKKTHLELTVKNSSNGGEWRFSTTAETNSIKAEHQDGSSLFIIAGRQIVTKERLEVLALATDNTFQDGRPIREVIANVKDVDAVAVIPWGFGKWLGSRGELLKTLFQEDLGSGVLLGDNGGRISLLPFPVHFDQANSKNIKILPGSDPLPFTSEISRLGSFGFSMSGNINEDKPAASIKKLLLDKQHTIEKYGQLQNPIRFLINQVRIRLVK